jgi:iron(III) transport system ATP-binding protein
VVLAVRAERVRLDGDSPDNTIPARVQSRVYIGSTYQYLLSTADGLLRVESPRDVSGPEVRVYLPPEGIVVLADDAAAPVTMGQEIPAPV